MKVRFPNMVISLAASTLPAASSAAGAAKFEPHGAVDVGARPWYGVFFSDCAKKYLRAPGFTIYARGLYRPDFFYN